MVTEIKQQVGDGCTGAKTVARESNENKTRKQKCEYWFVDCS